MKTTTCKYTKAELDFVRYYYPMPYEASKSFNTGAYLRLLRTIHPSIFVRVHAKMHRLAWPLIPIPGITPMPVIPEYFASLPETNPAEEFIKDCLVYSPTLRLIFQNGVYNAPTPKG